MRRNVRSGAQRFLGFLCVLVSVSAGGLDAQAQVDPIRFVWHGSPRCGAPENAGTEVARLLGQRELEPTVFDVQISDVPGGFELSLRFADAAPETARTLRLGSCAEIREAALLLAAMAIDPSAIDPKTLAPSEQTPTPSEPHVTESEPKPAQEPLAPANEPEREQRERPNVRATLELLGMIDLFTLPKWSGGPSLGAKLARKVLRFGVHGRYLFASQASGLPAGAEAQIDLFAGALQLGAAFALGRFTLGPSSEIELGYLRGRGSGVPRATPSGTLWSSAWGGVTTTFPLRGPVGLIAQALLGLPLQRPRFALHGEAPFYTTAPVTLRFFLGLSVALSPTD